MFSGLLIMDVDDGSPAEKIGLQTGQLSVTIEGEPWVLGGDILTAVNEQTVTNTEQYTKVLQALQSDR
jgi:serine protease Do